MRDLRECQFASDNTAGISSEAIEAIIEANTGCSRSYGEDWWTAKAADSIREFFETDCEVFFVFNGTAANSLALSSLCRSYQSILCHQLAHIETDECGGPEFFTHGTKILTVDGENGKVNTEKLEHLITRRNDVHYPRPKVVSVTQPTEVGTVYTPDELEAVGELSKKYGLFVHMDGARFANALAALTLSPAELSWKRGVDVLCLGGTKNGMPAGEAVVFFNKQLAEDFDYRCKQVGQLASKMRFFAAPWYKMLKSGSFVSNAMHANRCAGILQQRIGEIKQITRVFPCEANAVLLSMPESFSSELQGMGWEYYEFFVTGYSRFMCSWNTEVKDIDLLINDMKGIGG
ncbi:low specificity L-threonine aldolase [Chitinispirillales bacterium ANBcel5]|uniref:threonine aldolase family protein n=1 Tax=Cellulosispirillum alkaliphilum TaxID=3039283 RepID=UPI002A4EFE2E|nr:low specificity L-threonine aldolase [Chitinispirillales bacterium ANBcel5]